MFVIVTQRMSSTAKSDTEKLSVIKKKSVYGLERILSVFKRTYIIA